MPPSGVKNSYKNLLLSGKVIVSDDPSPPVTLSATITALGIVNVCATKAQDISNITLPNLPVAGKFVKDNVNEAFVVIV